MAELRHIKHDWRVLDELLGYYVRRDGDTVQIKAGNDVYTLDLAEFNALRGTGPKPRGLR